MYGWVKRNWQLHYVRLAVIRDRTLAMRWLQGARSCAGAAALAAAVGTVTVPAAAETVVSGYLGEAWTRDSDLHVRQPATGSAGTFRGMAWDSKSFESPPYYGLRATYFPERYPQWGIGLDFTHYKIYAKTAESVPVDGVWNGAAVNEVAPLGNRVQKFNVSHGVNYVGPTLTYRWRLDATERFPEGRWNPYVGGGPVYYINHPENTVNWLTNDERYESSGWGWQAFGGVSYRLTPSVSVFGELKYNEGTAKATVAGGGNAETDLSTTHAVIGIGWAF